MKQDKRIYSLVLKEGGSVTRTVKDADAGL
jgi:hypothetical protein